jgi:hypothetical protein
VTEPTRLKPVDAPKPDIAPADRVTACLEQALHDHKLDMQAGQPARAVICIFLREYPDGRWSDSWLSQGMNTLEALGLLSATAHDVNEFGIDNGPDHWPNGRPDLEEDDTDEPA